MEREQLNIWGGGAQSYAGQLSNQKWKESLQVLMASTVKVGIVWPWWQGQILLVCWFLSPKRK